MNTTNQTRWPIALAAVVLALTAACGTQIAPAPSDIGGADGDVTTDTRYDDNPARLDFGDNGRG
jgi:hypothetical protein